MKPEVPRHHSRAGPQFLDSRILTKSFSGVKTLPYSMRRRMRALLVAAILVGSGATGYLAWSTLSQKQGQVEIAVQDVALVADRPVAGQTELHLFLVVRNMRDSPASIGYMVLDAWDPDNGTVYDTYAHADVTVGARQAVQFSEVSTLVGSWSQVTFQVRVVTPTGWWEQPLTPDLPVVYPYA